MNIGKVRNFIRFFIQTKNAGRFKGPAAFTKFHSTNKICKLPNLCGTNSNFATPIAIFSAGILSFFSKDEEESPEQKLITTIKRSILCIQEQKYEKAEQMLHLALRMAQDQQNKNGITYVYDVMANLALDREQFKKAEKLFVDVMKMLFAEGHTEDSIKVLAINSKIAHIAQLEGNLEKALQGFEWTLGKIEHKLKAISDDQDLKELWGLTRNWFGQLLMEQGKYEDAKKCFLDAYRVFIEIHGKLNTEAVMLLNNLSVVYTKLDDYTEAKKFLEDALELVEQLPELAEAGILKANLGLIYLRYGMIQQAKEACSLAWRIGRKFDNEMAVQQADYCLKTINELQNQK